MILSGDTSTTILPSGTPVTLSFQTDDLTGRPQDTDLQKPLAVAIFQANAKVVSSGDYSDAIVTPVASMTIDQATMTIAGEWGELWPTMSVEYKQAGSTPADGLASQQNAANPNSACGISNLGACFTGLGDKFNSELWLIGGLAIAILLLVAFISPGGQSVATAATR